MITKINHPVFCISSSHSGPPSVVCCPLSVLAGLPSAVRRLSSVFLLLAASAWAGDLTTDNLTVAKDATIMGNMYFSSTVSGTNGGAAATGGTITTNGGYIIHTFTNVGMDSFIVSGGSLTCDVLVVAGGGCGQTAVGGGGGAGGVVYTNIVVTGSNSVEVGKGGAGAVDSDTVIVGRQGSNSVFGNLIAYGGGVGADGAGAARPPTEGGSGGGGGATYGDFRFGGAGVSGQGYAGGDSYNVEYKYSSAGGGGAGGVGGSVGTGDLPGGMGGLGITNSISGAPVIYAGGGGGGSYYSTGGAGGSGVGGTGSTGVVPAENGAENTGSGGGGGYGGGSGGSGIVIVRYPVTTSGNSSNVATLTISSNGISQTSTFGANVLMGKVGIGTNSPAEQLHVVGNARVDGTNIVSAITLGGETRATWPTGNLSGSNNLADITDQAAARTNLGLGSIATNNADAFLTPTGNGSQLTGITAGQVGALSTNGGVVNGNVGIIGVMSIDGSISILAPAGDIPMGVYTNQ